MKNLNDSPYKYEEWANDAMLGIVKKTIKTLETEGLYKDIHFYITFNTKDRLVKLPDFLKKEYPETMTIVLQNHFSNLKTSTSGFSVELTFASVPVTLFIPWESITNLLDPVSPISFSVNNKLTKPNNTTISNKIIKFPKK